jgi:membrane protease YdiL (CAAX protease family)
MGPVDDLDATTKHWHHGAALALGSLALAAALTWQPLALLVDTMLHWPNIAMALSQVALVACAAVICAVITSVASGHQPPLVVRRFTRVQYRLGAVVAAVGLAVFLAAGRRYEVPPAEYLNQNATAWVLPLVLYVPLALTLVAWAAMRHSPR